MGQVCLGRRARGHGRVEAREKKGCRELECRMGADFVSLICSTEWVCGCLQKRYLEQH